MSKLENNTIVHPPVEAAGLLQTDQGRHLYQVLEYIPHQTPLLSNTPLVPHLLQEAAEVRAVPRDVRERECELRRLHRARHLLRTARAVTQVVLTQWVAYNYI